MESVLIQSAEDRMRLRASQRFLRGFRLAYQEAMIERALRRRVDRVLFEQALGAWRVLWQERLAWRKVHWVWIHHLLLAALKQYQDYWRSCLIQNQLDRSATYIVSMHALLALKKEWRARLHKAELNMRGDGFRCQGATRAPHQGAAEALRCWILDLYRG